MKYKIFMSLIIISSFFAITTSLSAQSTSLAGQWQFKLDPKDIGEGEKWFEADLPDSIKLPGSTAENGYGDDISTETQWTGTIVDKSWFTDEKYEKYRQPGSIKLPFWLTPAKHYVGAAWYQKTVEVPESWRDKRIVFFLERAHWETRLWVDGKEVGTQNSLCAPHQYELGKLAPGRHRLAIRIDNTVKIDVGENAHSVSDHTQTNWNGIIGKIELRATDAVWIEDVQVYPDVQNKTAKVHITIANDTAETAEGTLTLQAQSSWPDNTHKPAPKSIKFEASKPQADIEVEYPMGDDVLLWDEFSPNVYQMSVALNSDGYTDSKGVDFGMRQLATEDTQFTINGRKTFLRGTLECCIFPLTGYPAMDVEQWLRIFRIAKAHGLNHFRFHSWCPPEAAFEAADRKGFMLHVETPVWTKFEGDPVLEQFIYAEGDRILKTYGNHPSFCMLASGNEAGGGKRKEVLSKLVQHWKQKDSRRLYTAGASGPYIEESDYHVYYNEANPVRGQNWKAGLKGRYNAEPPQTDFDYSISVSQHNVPLVSHEIGQWCVYPNFKEIDKYTGILRATNFEIFRDSLAKHHMLDQAEDFLAASGKLQVKLYKEEIETALRTPGFGGFQLLDLHDFPGQGTALIGVLDAFWDEKEYITPEEYRRFCGEVVPLLRTGKLTWTTNETFAAEVQIANFGPRPIEKAAINWSISYADGRQIKTGQLRCETIAIGNGTKLGRIELPLENVKAPSKLLIKAVIESTPYANDWEIWVYPAEVDTSAPKDVIIAERLDEKTQAALKSGRKVLLMPPLESIDSRIPPGFSTIFWNTQFTQKQPPHTLGLLCDPNHPALAKFPTDFHGNWQWWDMVTNSRFMKLDEFEPRLRPIVQVIDDWNTNRRLGLIFEAKVGNGKLLVCSIDLRTNLDKRPVARQMLHSLLVYMQSECFEPEIQCDIETIKKLFKTPAL